MFLIALLILVGALLLVHVLCWHVVLMRGLGRPAPPARALEGYPSVTVIRPVKGRDVGQDENLRAALDTGYPGDVETIFVFDDEEDPGLPAALAAVAAHAGSGAGGEARVLLSGPPPPGRTGKLNAMIAGAREARGELIAFADSDTRPDREVLRVMVETLIAGGPSAGCVFPPVVVPGEVRSLGDACYALMINGLYGPVAALLAGRSGEMPFIMGQMMVFRRETIEAIGGIETADGQLVDDIYLGARVVQTGRKNLMSGHPLHIVIGGQSFREFLMTYRRWLLFSRNGLPSSLARPHRLLGTGFWLALAIVAVSLASGHPATAILPGLSILVWGWSVERQQRRFAGAGAAPHSGWTVWLICLIAPVIVATMFRRRVNWRGRDYELDLSARLNAK